MKTLVPCPSCQRHVRASEASCPFCASALPAALVAQAVPAATQRMKRAAAFAFTASLALAGCGDTTTPPADAAAVDSATDSSTDSSTDTAPADSSTDTGPADNGGMMALYGLPPADAGSDASAPDAAADAATDNGGSAALYGAPPPDVAQTDASDNDAAADGAIGVRYGAPPADVWV